MRVMIRRIAAFIALFSLGAVDAQAATRPYPSLAKRPVESHTRETGTVATPAPAAADPALAQEVSSLQTKATTADAAFQSELGKQRENISAATGSAVMSEAWVAAQMAISTVDSVRYESVAALATLDTLNVARQDSADTARVTADLATIEPVRTRVLAIVDAQNDALDTLRNSLKTP